MAPPNVNAFAGGRLDRAGERRADRAWISARLGDGASKAVLLWNGSPLVDGAGAGTRLRYVGLDLARELGGASESLLFLGLDGDKAVFGLGLEAKHDPAHGPLEGLGRFEDLRQVASVLPPEEAALAATAKAVFEWARRHRFCAACGQPSEPADAGWRRICSACGTQHFPRLDPAVIMLPTFRDRCLVGRHTGWSSGRFSTLAGFVEPGESIEEACARELKEETGLETVAVAYHSSQPWPWPSSLMIGLFAEVAGDQAAPDRTELEEIRWLTRAEVQQMLGGALPGVSPPLSVSIAHTLLRCWAGG